jgi:hypothetical protein
MAPISEHRPGGLGNENALLVLHAGSYFLKNGIIGNLPDHLWLR